MTTFLLTAAAISEATFLRLAPMNAEPTLNNEITAAEERAASAQYGAVSDANGLMTKRYAAFYLGWTKKGLYFATRTSVPPRPRTLADADVVTLEVLSPGAKEAKKIVRRVSEGRMLDGVVDYGVLCAETESLVTWEELGVRAPAEGEKWGVNMHVDFSEQREHARWHYAKGKPEELASVVFDSAVPTPSLVDFGRLEAWRASMNYRMCFRFNNVRGEKALLKPNVTLYRGIGSSKLDSDPETDQEITRQSLNGVFWNQPLAAGTCEDLVAKIWVIIPGAVSHLNVDLDVAGKKLFKRTLRWDVSKGLDWSTLEVPFVKAAFYPVKDNFLRAYFNPFHVARMCDGVLRVHGKRSGKVFWEKELAKTNGRIYTQYVHDHLPKNLPEDDYVVRFAGKDLDGKTYSAEATFAVKKFPWQNNALGRDRVLVPPFTAIKVEEWKGGKVEGWKGGKVEGWKGGKVEEWKGGKVEGGDRISFLQTGYQCGGILWDKVFFKDENLLAGPIELKLNDKTFTVTGVRYLEKSPDRVVREVTAVLPASQPSQPSHPSQLPKPSEPLSLRVTQDYDQDGFCFLTFAFDSAEEVEVKTLRLSVPLRNELAKYFNVLNRAGDRRAGPTLDFTLKDGEGEVWNSTAWTQGGRRAKFPAAIQPYIWFGGAMKGFCWTMDSVRHLSLDNGVPAERIIRRGGAATLVCDLVNVPVKWRGKKTIEMGVQPTPVKPKAPAYGRFASQLYKYACPSNAVKITSSWGAFSLHPMVSAMNLYPNDDLSLTKWVFSRDKVDLKAYRTELNRYVEKNRAWFERSKTTGVADFLAQHEHDSRYMGTKVGMCYNNPMLITCFWPEWEMYKSEWWPDQCFVPENYYNEYMGQLARSRIDFQLWHEKHQLDLGADGIYFDCFFTRGAEGLESENVWVKEDNTLQPQLTGFLRWRELLKRTAILCLKEGKTYAGRPIVENHDTMGNAVPMASWLMTGLSTERGQDGGDFQDRFPEAYTLVDIVGAQAGKGTRFLVMTDRGDQARKDRELKSLIGFMCAYGIFSIEDQGLYSDLPEFERAWNAVFDYGWGRPEVEQICYWDDTKEKPVAHTGKDVRLTVAKKSQSMLLMFGNLGEAAEFSFAAKGTAEYDYVDEMTGRPVDPAHVAIERHGYRLIRAVRPDAASDRAATPMHSGRKLVWHDEFSGGRLDDRRWKFRRSMSSSDCVYANDARTYSVEDGFLKLRVQPSDNPKKLFLVPEGVSTHDRMHFRYGYLEMRARVPFRHGAWPSFWLTGAKRERTAPWFPEVDVFEVFSSSNTVVSTIHKWQSPGKHVALTTSKKTKGSDYRFADCSKLNDEFHTYGLEWSPKTLKFYVDGNLYQTMFLDAEHDFTLRDGTLSGLEGFRDPMGININNEVFTPGHGWCPKAYACTPEDPLPIEYWIDWVRLWQRPDSDEAIVYDAAKEGEGGGKSVKFMLFADLHCVDCFPNGDFAFLDEIIRQAKAQGCEFMVHLGDLVNNVSDPVQRECVRRYNESGLPAYHVMGNHDMDLTSYKDVVKAFGMPAAHYFFDRGGFRFIVLDANYARTADGRYVHFERGHPSWKVKPGEVNDWIPPEQLAWFEKVIAESPHSCVVLAHHSIERPPALSGVQNGEEVRAVINAANRRKPGSVRLVMNGHHHIDNLRILEKVLYWDVNGASYQIYGRKHDKYPADYVQKHSQANCCVAWDAPLYAIVTLGPDGRVQIQGAEANWRYGVTPEQAGYPKCERDGRPVHPKIQSVDLKLGF